LVLLELSIGGNYYALVIVDDFSIFTWTLFLVAKNETFYALKKLAYVLENEKDSKIVSLRSDHGGEFQNENLSTFVKNMLLSITFQLLELHNKMEWLRKRTDH